jgi:hypothetical protein
VIDARVIDYAGELFPPIDQPIDQLIDQLIVKRDDRCDQHGTPQSLWSHA